MAGINLRTATDQELEEWDEVVEASPQGSVFHRRAWLEAAARQSGTEFVPLVGSKGEEINCLFPVFLKRMHALTVLFSPPPGCGIPALGPIFTFSSTKQLFIEATAGGVADAFAAYVDEIGACYVSVRTRPSLQDVRPFIWAGFQARPHYTYAIALDRSEDEVFAGFQSETRRNIRRALKYEDLEIITGESDDFDVVYELTRTRYDEQGIRWRVARAYVEALQRHLAPEYLQVRVALYGGEPISGIITAHHGEEVLHWIGAVTPRRSVTGVNELLHWRVIQEAQEEGRTRYDLVGANTPHLCRHKAKYGPEPVLYFSLERTTLVGRALWAASSSNLARRVFGNTIR